MQYCMWLMAVGAHSRGMLMTTRGWQGEDRYLGLYVKVLPFKWLAISNWYFKTMTLTIAIFFSLNDSYVVKKWACLNLNWWSQSTTCYSCGTLGNKCKSREINRNLKRCHYPWVSPTLMCVGVLSLHVQVCKFSLPAYLALSPLSFLVRVLLLCMCWCSHRS